MVTGSLFAENRANGTTELYDTKDDDKLDNNWKELARLNTPRHFHSMCDRNGDFVYVFCGIAAMGRGLLVNSVERMKIKDENGMNFGNPWMRLELPTHEFTDLWDPRRTPGVCCIGEGTLLLFGGRKMEDTLSDYYIIKTYKQSGGFRDITKHKLIIYDEPMPIWPYEIVHLSDSYSEIGFTVDYFSKRLFKFKNGKFEF